MCRKMQRRDCVVSRKCVAASRQLMAPTWHLSLPKEAAPRLRCRPSWVMMNSVKKGESYFCNILCLVRRRTKHLSQCPAAVGACSTWTVTGMNLGSNSKNSQIICVGICCYGTLLVSQTIQFLSCIILSCNCISVKILTFLWREPHFGALVLDECLNL